MQATHSIATADGDTAVADRPVQPVLRSVRLQAGAVYLEGDLELPANPLGLVIFAHGSGSSRRSSRNRHVAQRLTQHGIGTLQFDLLAAEEDRVRAARVDIVHLANRLALAVAWARLDPSLRHLPIGLFGAGTGAAAALEVAARCADDIAAVVSRGGRPDLAGPQALANVSAPTLLIVGDADTAVLALNRAALDVLAYDAEVAVVAGATHLFEEPGTLEQTALLAANWFQRWMPQPLMAARRDRQPLRSDVAAAGPG